MHTADVVIVGGGIAGVSLAARLGRSASVIVIEAEEHLGMHATGRSASMLVEAYGPPVIRELTARSRPFFTDPPEGFTPAGLARSRATLVYAATGHDPARLRREYDDARRAGGGPDWLGRDGVLAACPLLRREGISAGFLDRSSLDLDTHALLQGFARAAGQSGARFTCRAGLAGIHREPAGWRLGTAEGDIRCAILVNAAGAWADGVARLAGVMPLGLRPLRRTAATLPLPADLAESVGDLPMTLPVDESFYFKPDAGAMLVSLAEETPAEPGDAAADDFDVALALERFHEATTVPRARPRAVWAGLRTFSPDRSPAVGFDRAEPAFFWHAALGGYGIQTAPALSVVSAGLLAGDTLDADGRRLADALSPARFRGPAPRFSPAAAARS